MVIEVHLAVLDATSELFYDNFIVLAGKSLKLTEKSCISYGNLMLLKKFERFLMTAQSLHLADLKTVWIS